MRTPRWIFLLTFCSPCLAQNPPADPRGIYVYTEHLAQDASLVTQALSVAGVDGLTLLLGWASLEPSRGSFSWTELDQWMSTAVQSNKKVALAIRAGQDTPCWLFQAPACGAGYSKPYAGATPLSFLVSPREGVGQSTCNPETIAAPWDPVFQSEWAALLGAVAAHLKSAGEYQALTSVRLTGINRTTSELRLPAEMLSSPCTTNSVATWLAADPPFRSATLLSAWDQLTTTFLTNFPDKLFGVEIIPTASGDSNLEYPFPAIDDQGCAYQPPWPADPQDPNYKPTPCLNKSATPDQNAPLLALASQRFANRLSVSYQNLDLSQPAQPYVVYAAQAWGTAIGFQTNDYDNLQRAACSGGSAKPGPCTSSSYLALLELGIFPLGKSNPLRAEYIEVLPPDAISFPDAVNQAHRELLIPQISAGGVIIHAGTSGVASPGSLVDIYGSNLAGAAASAMGGSSLPETLGDVQVLVNGTPAPLIYAGPQQIVFQLPYETRLGMAQVAVISGGVSGAAAPLSVQRAAPLVLTYGANRAIAVNSDGTVNGAGNGAKPGSFVTAYLIGSGPLDNPILTGELAPASPLSHESLPTTMKVGGSPATVQFAGMAPGFVGLMQLNFVLPTLPPGDYPVEVAIGGISSNQPLLAVSR
ncbi:MAG TPA: IPT/TIG domain-containing protein [Bryobacteraceae bacterium]|nr:IPT/TIG domain-containing protein [Bryobacteraceae bacterium]